MKDHTEENPTPKTDVVCSAWYSGFKKKSGRSNVPSSEVDFSEDIHSELAGQAENIRKTIDW